MPQKNTKSAKEGSVGSDFTGANRGNGEEEELRHPNHFYRERAADALGGLHIDPEVVVPALTNLVQDSSPAARFIAIMALGRFGPAARPAAPLILETLKTREDLQWVSKNALREIAPEMLTNGPAR